jgi:hypothetical protein
MVLLLQQGPCPLLALLPPTRQDAFGLGLGHALQPALVAHLLSPLACLALAPPLPLVLLPLPLFLCALQVVLQLPLPAAFGAGHGASASNRSPVARPNTMSSSIGCRSAA